MVTSTRSIRDQVRVAFRVLNGLLIAVAAVAVLALLAVRHSANEEDVDARLNNIAIKIQAGAFAAGMHEKDFLLDIKTLGVEKAKQKDAALVASTLAGLMRLSENGT